MLLNEFSESNFSPNDEKQNIIIEKLKEVRAALDVPDRALILKALERTRPYTRTVYPTERNSK